MSGIIGDSQVEQGAEGQEQTEKQEAPQEVNLFDKSGRFLGGRFDTDDGQITPEMVEQNPHLAKLAQSYAHLEREYGQAKNRLQKASESLPDDFFDDPNRFKLARDGGLDKTTREALEGRPITKTMLDRFEALNKEIAQVQTQRQQQFQKQWDDQTGGRLEEIVDWVRRSRNQDEIDALNEDLANPHKADRTMRWIVEDYERANNVQVFTSGDRKPEPTRTYQTGNAPAGGVTGFATMQEYTDFVAKARRLGDKPMLAEAKRRLAASAHLVNQNPGINLGPNMTDQGG